jgi:hypothetical protein
VHPAAQQVVLVEQILNDPKLRHVFMDISWSEAAKYATASPEAIERVSSTLNRHPDRFLFGTDEVGPTDQAKYLRVYEQYAPILAKLTPDAKQKLLTGNYERLFDGARRKVRAWERANVPARR